MQRIVYGGLGVVRQTGKKRMTLSEHLALRARVAEEAKAQEVRMQSIRALRELNAQVVCNCPACVRRRQIHAK